MNASTFARTALFGIAGGFLGLSAACAPTQARHPEPIATTTPGKSAAAGVTAASDPLGPKPALPPAKPYTPPVPEVFEEAGLKVWLVERHELPLVAVRITVPYGSASDPVGAAGLAGVTADMLDEGAGPRGAVELSSAVTELGATLRSTAQPDGSSVAVTVLKKNLTPAFQIFADVVARPRLDPKEWKRVHALWLNDLRSRPDDPARVSRVVTSAALYGPTSPYGHPTDGYLATAAKIELPQIRRFHAASWRRDRAVLVAVGDVTREEITARIRASLGDWRPPATPAPEAVVPTAPDQKTARLILVDRPEAPQSVIAFVRAGVAASNPLAPSLDLVNTALGGSFTSRLNQKLREEKGWSYGARSGFAETRGVGSFVARAAVRTDVTGPALAELLKELKGLEQGGLTDEEVEKVRAQDRADLVQTYEPVGGVAERLSQLVAMGLPPNHDAVCSLARQASSKPHLDRLAQRHFGPREGTIVVVGPRKIIEEQLRPLQLPAPEIWTAEAETAK